tara:strand:+ start:52 stop:291 length:240 start_codon:yes stop_codon:yes gene_type:complete
LLATIKHRVVITVSAAIVLNIANAMVGITGELEISRMSFPTSVDPPEKIQYIAISETKETSAMVDVVRSVPEYSLMPAI